MIPIYVALDIYGTILATEDWDNELPVREGTEALIKRLMGEGAKIISSSDAPIEDVKFNLEGKIDFSLFFDFIRFNETPKDFTKILNRYNVSHRELLVIGDNPAKDERGAELVGARCILVPEYKDLHDNFNMNTLEI